MSKCLYLVSSSASREYVADCLEALALPRGMVHHFRYASRHLDDDLKSLLRSKPGKLADELCDVRIVVVYLYQEQSGGKWKPLRGSYLPLRCGRLIEAYREGDVAHFYFEVNDYIKAKVGGASARELLNKLKFRKSSAKDAKESYAHFARDLRLAAGSTRDTLEFQRFVDEAYVPGEWRTRSSGSTPLDVTYDVVFVRIDGIFFEKRQRLWKVPVRLRQIVGNPFAEYELEAGTTYYIKVMTYFSARVPAQLPGRGRARLRLEFDRDLIKPAGATSFPISSNYDLHYWSVVPASGADGRTSLTISCEHNDAATDSFLRREVICPEISLPISVVLPS